MTFFKVLQNNKVVSVGTVFLEWNIKKHKMYVSDIDDGQFVQAYDESQIYRDTWMKPAPSEATSYVYATVIIIGQTEYEDLKAMLDDKEEIIEEPVVQRPVIQPEIEETTEQKPMSIAEIREIILKQQEQINTLMQKVND